MIIRNDNITEASLGLSVGDADAQTYINRVLAYESITPQRANALNDFFVALKANGIWSKIRLMYPMIGSITQTHFLEATGNYRYLNLFLDLDYSDSNSSHQSFSDADGLGGVTNAYLAVLRTNNTTNSIFNNGVNDVHISAYSQDGGNAYLISNYQGADAGGLNLISGVDFVTKNVPYRFGAMNSEGNKINYGKGLFVARRTTGGLGYSGKISLLQNNTLLDEFSEDVNPEQNDTLRTENVQFIYSPGPPPKVSFFSLGYYMNDSETTIFTNLVEQLQVALDRGQA